MRGVSLVNHNWHFRTLAPTGAPRQLQPSFLNGGIHSGSTVASRIELFQEAKQNGQVRSTRARSKQDRDQDRHVRRLEKSRILQEAFYDSGAREGASHQSPGEVDALSDSTTLNVSRGDVLRDPKIRTRQGPYVHPAMRQQL